MSLILSSHLTPETWPFITWSCDNKHSDLRHDCTDRRHVFLYGEAELQMGFCSSCHIHWLFQYLWLSEKSSAKCQLHVSENRTQKWKRNTGNAHHQWITTGLCCTMTPTIGESSERSVTVRACVGGGSVPPLLEVNAKGKPVPCQVCWVYCPYCWG